MSVTAPRAALQDGQTHEEADPSVFAPAVWHMYLLKLVHGDVVILKLGRIGQDQQLLDYAARELERLLDSSGADYTWDDLAPKTALWMLNLQHERLPPLHEIPTGEHNAECDKAQADMQQLGYRLVRRIEDEADRGMSPLADTLQRLRAKCRAAECDSSAADDQGESGDESDDSQGDFIAPEGEVSEEEGDESEEEECSTESDEEDEDDDSQSEHSEYLPSPRPPPATRGKRRRGE